MKHNTPDLDSKYCLVCNGTKKTYEEHPDGSLSEHVCSYCHGTGNSVWVKQRFDARISRQEMIKGIILIYWAVVFFFINPLWHVNVMIPITAWVIAWIGAGWFFTHPKPSKRRQRKYAEGKLPRRPDPLTTDHERLMIGGVLGAAVVKHELGNLQARLDANTPKPPR